MGNWAIFIEFSGIGIVLMCLALLTLTSSSIDIVKQRSNSGEVGIFSYSPDWSSCSLLFIVASWFMREVDGMIKLVLPLLWDFCMMMMSTVMLSHFNRRLVGVQQIRKLCRSIPHPHTPWNWLRFSEFSTSKGFDIREYHRYQLCNSSLERIFDDESFEGSTILHRQICKTTFSICTHRIFSATFTLARFNCPYLDICARKESFPCSSVT